MARARRLPLAASCARPSVMRRVPARVCRAGVWGVMAGLTLLSNTACGMLDVARAPYAAAPPAPSAPWRPSESQVQARAGAASSRPRVEVETDKTYALPDLIDLAQRVNPETRRAWEQARAAAARRGQAAAAYFPSLIVGAVGGQSRIVDRGPDGSFTVEGQSLVPGLSSAI